MFSEIARNDAGIEGRKKLISWAHKKTENFLWWCMKISHSHDDDFFMLTNKYSWKIHEYKKEMYLYQDIMNEMNVERWRRKD
jgi:hypothetical protein